MIQVKRGSTNSWRGSDVKLEPGQPGYDKDKHKLKIGDGISSWLDLPYIGGLAAEEILDSESNAKTRMAADLEDLTLITYGVESPDAQTVGRIYLQVSSDDSDSPFMQVNNIYIKK